MLKNMSSMHVTEQELLRQIAIKFGGKKISITFILLL